MAQLSGLSTEQVARGPLFPKERGGKRVDDRKVLRGIIPVMQKGLRCGWMPPGRRWPHKTLDNCCRRW